MPEGLRNNEEEGGDFLKEKYSDLPNSEEVESAAKRQEIRGGEKPKNKAEKIETYLKRLDEIFSTEDETKKEFRTEFLKEKLHDKFIIKEIPESYFEHQQQIARERGHGDLEYNDEGRRQETEIIIKDQEQSLDNWVDYLGSSDAGYPNWLKYWAFRSVTNLGQGEKDENGKVSFAKREFAKYNENGELKNNPTIKPFPDINREALAYVLDAVEKQYKAKKTKKKGEVETTGPTDEQWEALLKTQNFGKLYGHAIEKVTPATEEEKENIQGEWVTYDKSENSEDAKPLYESLQGHGTGWCIAGESVAENYLKQGDHHIFYTKGKDGLSKVPRVCVRMANGEIAEVRGIESNQNLEPVMVDIAKEKYNTLPGGERYEKRCADMKQLTEIEKKFVSTKEFREVVDTNRGMVQLRGHLTDEEKNENEEAEQKLSDAKLANQNIELTKEELKFLYELDGKIEGFGYQEDPRIEELKNQRDGRKDYAQIFDCKPEEVAFKVYFPERYERDLLNLREFDAEQIEEILRKKQVEKLKETLNDETVVFVGDLKMSLISQMPKNLKNIVGDADFRYSTIEDMGHLESVSGAVLIIKDSTLDLNRPKIRGRIVALRPEGYRAPPDLG